MAEDIWREFTDEDAALWDAVFQERDVTIRRLVDSDRCVTVIGGIAHGLGIVCVSVPDSHKFRTTFFVTTKSGLDSTTHEKVELEFNRACLLVDESEEDAKAYRRNFLPREAEGVSERLGTTRHIGGRMKQERSNPLGRKDNAWWDVTWNPITGCTRVSPGCQHCYAHNQYDRFPVVIHGLGVGTYDCPYDREPIPFSALVFHADRLSLPLHWKKPRRVFVCSMSDFLHEQVRPEWLAQMWTVFSTCQQHSFYLLTKRPENAPAKMAGLPTLPNVHIGVTVESYEYERRIDLLGDIPGGSFVSVEPMLSAVIRVMPPYVTWVICGAETGPSARPIDLDMAYRLRRQCADAGIPFWFKSAGRGVTIPEDLDVMEVPNAKQ